MQVSVAGVKDVRDSQLIPGSDVVSSAEHFRQTRARNDRVLDHRIRRDASDCAKRALARGPKLLAFGFVTCVPATARAILETNTSNPLGFKINPRLDSIQLDQQGSACIRR